MFSIKTDLKTIEFRPIGQHRTFRLYFIRADYLMSALEFEYFVHSVMSLDIYTPSLHNWSTSYRSIHSTHTWCAPLLPNFSNPKLSRLFYYLQTKDMTVWPPYHVCHNLYTAVPVRFDFLCGTQLFSPRNHGGPWSLVLESRKSRAWRRSIITRCDVHLPQSSALVSTLLSYFPHLDQRQFKWRKVTSICSYDEADKRRGFLSEAASLVSQTTAGKACRTFLCHLG